MVVHIWPDLEDVHSMFEGVQYELKSVRLDVEMLAFTKLI